MYHQHRQSTVDIFPLKSNYFNITSTTTLNKAADRGSPCFTADSTLKPSVYSLLILTRVLVLIFVNSNSLLTLILRRSRTGTVWFYTSTSNKRAARPKLYTKSLTRDLKRMYSRLKLVRISIKL